MIGARDMESAILGGYADHVRRLHPDAPWPGVYLADDLFDDARAPARTPGRREVLRPAQPGRPAGRSGARSAQAWTAARFEAAVAAPPGDEPRGRLVGDLVKHLFPAYQRRLGGQDRVVPVARQGPERHQPPRQGAGLRRPDPVPRRADPLARLARRRPRLRPPRGAEAGQAGRAPDARPAGADRQLRRPPARPARPGRRERPRRRAAQLRRRPAALGGPVPHDHPGGPQPARHRREARPAAQGRGVPPGAEAGLRAGDQGPPRGHADAC